MAKSSQIVQGSLFEEDYLIRSLGSITRDPEYAITELVANAWDAGATTVEVRIPSILGETISIVDDGHGMTKSQFIKRWMTLGYLRERHQGRRVEFPSEIKDGIRYAYGKNGIGRHSMLCFCSEYFVRTWRDGEQYQCTVRLSSGKQPFIAVSESVSPRDGHGTEIEGIVEKNLPDADTIRETISARFIHDPSFVVMVNGSALDLPTLRGVEDPVMLDVPLCGSVEVIILDTLSSARTKQRQGFAFWIQGRLVGEPSWTLANTVVIDARETFGRRFTILVKCDCMESEVESDWSGFKKGAKRQMLFDAVSNYAVSRYRSFSHERMDDTKRQVYQEYLPQLRALSGPSRDGVTQFVEAIVSQDPTYKPEDLSVAVKAVLNLQQTRNGQHLLQTLSTLPSDDIEALDRLLDEWSAQDALLVLDEIDRRIATVRAIEMLESNSETDELHTLHPLVTESRWLFGAEYESCEYSSNRSLVKAVNQVFSVVSTPSDYENWKKRPDLLMLADSTLSAVALEDYDGDAIVRVKKVLLIELKRGGSLIGREEMNQAESYIDDIRSSGHLSGDMMFHCFVVGSRVNPKITTTKVLKDESGHEHSTIRGLCYSTMTQTAGKRLFNLKERLEERYSATSQSKRSKILEGLLQQPTQESLEFEVKVVCE
jgi:hypothetical protein